MLHCKGGHGATDGQRMLLHLTTHYLTVLHALISLYAIRQLKLLVLTLYFVCKQCKEQQKGNV